MQSCRQDACAPKEFGVSDGNRTRNIRFGRPALSRLSFAHKFWCIGEDSNFRSVNRDSFTDCLPLPTGDRCVKNKKFCVKIKKAEKFRQTSGAEMPRISRTRFLTFGNSPKFLSSVENHSKTLCLFLFLFGSFIFRRHLRSPKDQNFRTFFRLFSCQTSV